ncbi:MAG TPA: RIP metalloprotease RseP [Terriglobia bacterium]|nr:RIP metalloprotease RseP [Terriglobia bacterium]
MNTVLTDIVVVIVVLGFMIFIHEAGHFLAAKAFGIRVLIFSFGFGKRLFGIKRGDTDYRVSALPLGGYVKMAGDDPSDVHHDDPGEFLSRPRWQRFVVIVMGPVMNILLAVVLLACLYHYHFQKPAFEEQPAVVGEIEPGSAAEAAGVRPGDLIAKLDGLKNPKWEDVEIKTLMSAGETLPVEIVRDGQPLRLEVKPKAEGPDRLGNAGWAACVPAVVGEVDSGRPAAKAGVMPGDLIVSMNGQPIACWQDVVPALKAANAGLNAHNGDVGRPADLAVQRNGATVHLRLTAVYGEVQGVEKWYVGILPRNLMVVRQLPWDKAIEASVGDNVRNCVVTFDTIGKILTRKMSARSLSSPIGIAQYAGEAYRAGFSDLLLVAAFISLQLGIFNLLPIPVLDGGQILLLLIEAVIRRDLSVAVKERILQAGIAFLLLLVAFTVYNDIVKIVRPG